ncbi:sigma-70 family RNA polymerase sigma factor [Actinopolyspora mortivallis]|uniref:sigma-70 family RNA polymerase sigma factor n=1 Tax=Actinopolyspora mortivallis TaxID=33906 RepID=UPI000381ED14|nr:sigma-70 family RNA polymerase sigma factor [Actinopolyspora mortivallis]
MGTVPGDFEDAGDSELIEAVREGSGEAYGVLYRRHVAAAYNMARQLTNGSGEADDLVSEAFAKVLTGLRSGQGPDTAFRAYLLTTIRRTAYDRSRKDSKLRYSEEISAEQNTDLHVPFTDTAVAGLERSLAARAFQRLPERWQTVLWHLEIEEQSPAEVAPLLGLTPNGVSALAYRAREGLRQAYLQVHLGELEESAEGLQRCGATVRRLGAWTRGGLSRRETAQVDAHLDSCSRCSALAAELGDINGGLRSVVAPFLLGTAAAGYLAGKSASTAAAAGVTGAAGAGTAAGAAEAATSLPRQILGGAASTVALVVAVALGLAADGQQSVPAASEPPPPERSTPTPRPPEPDPSPPDPPPRPGPSPEPVEPSTPEEPPPAPPEPQPELVASGPAEPIRLVAGGDPKKLPVTVRNKGDGTSAPVTMRVSLPEGITARLPEADTAGGSGTAPANTAPAWFPAPSTTARRAAETSPGPGFTCTVADEALSCTTRRGLRPGETLRPEFRLRAGQRANDGRIVLDVTTANGLSLPLADVTVHVTPEREPGVAVTARGWTGIPWLARISARVTNTGDVPGTAVTTITLPERMRPVRIPDSCTHSEAALRCTAPLDPEERTDVTVWLVDSRFPDRENGAEPGHGFPWQREEPAEVTVTAELGEATDRQRVELGPWWPPLPHDWPHPDGPGPPEEPPSPERPSPPTTSPEGTETPGTSPPGTTPPTEEPGTDSTSPPPTPGNSPPTTSAPPETDRGPEPNPAPPETTEHSPAERGHGHHGHGPPDGQGSPPGHGRGGPPGSPPGKGHR